jgi:hypothetical protein
MFMLLFARCDNDHTAPHADQRRKYAEVEYSKYAKGSKYFAKGVYVAKGKYIEYAKDIVYATKGECGEYAKEDTSVKEGQNKPLAKEGDNDPLANDGNWLGTTMSPLPQGNQPPMSCKTMTSLSPQGQVTVYVVPGNDKPH